MKTNGKTNGHIPGADGFAPSAPATALVAQNRQHPQDTVPHEDFTRWMPVMGIEAAISRRQAIQEAVANLMQEGVDYGKIPGAERPTLMQPGADKLCNLFGLVIRYELEIAEEDFTGERHGGAPFFYYRIRGQAYRGEHFMGEGIGSCNAWESKYRWRVAARICPSCKKTAIIKGRAEYGGGWLCFKRKDGCGTTFADADPAITSQPVGRQENPDLPDVVNTVLKMAMKRCKVGTTINATSASEFFTQDVEDLTDDAEPEAPPKASTPQHTTTTSTRGAAAATVAMPSPAATIAMPWGDRPTRGDIKAAFFALTKRGVSQFQLDTVLAQYGIRTIDGFKSPEQAAEAYLKLAALAERSVA